MGNRNNIYIFQGYDPMAYYNQQMAYWGYQGYPQGSYPQGYMQGYNQAYGYGGNYGLAYSFVILIPSSISCKLVFK